MIFTYILLFQLFKYSYSIYGEFSQDLVSINIFFDKNTDKGNKNSEFQCSDLLVFNNVEQAKCIWKNDNTLNVYPGYFATILPYDSIYVVPNTIKYCTNNNCDSYYYILNEEIPFQTPGLIEQPVINLLLHDTSSYCFDVTIDNTKSTGSGGRPWNYIDIEIYKNDILEKQITEYVNFNKNTLLTSILSIPSSYFTLGTYTFNIILCNFVSSCSLGYKNIIITNTNITMNSYLGKDIFIKRNQLLQVNSELDIVGCNTNNFIQPVYTWILYELTNIKIDTKLESISKQASIYMLPINTLKPKTTYLLLLTVVRDIINSTSSVNIFVEEGNIIPFINGGNTQTLRVGETKRIDAINSYDEDNYNLNNDLIYDWTCYQTEGDICNYFYTLKETNDINSYVNIFTDGIFNNNTIITLKISNTNGRQVVTYIIIDVISIENPIITIDYGLSSTLTNINTNQPFQIYGYIESIFPISDKTSWFSNDSTVKFYNNVISLKQTNSEIITTQKQYIQLFINPYSLQSRSYFLFTLKSGDSVVSVTINTNGPPIPGIFTLVPKNGVELTDLFYFSALYWTDENIPLTYSYGQIEQTSLIYLQTSKTNLYNTILSVGGESNVTCFIIIEDNYGASTNKTDLVVLTKLTNENAENIVITNLQKNTLELDSINLQKTIALGTNIVNRYSCTNTNNCENKKEIRHSLVSGISNVVQFNTIDEKFIYSSTYSLNELTSNINELNNETAHIIIHIVDTLLQNSFKNVIKYDTINSILQSVDSSLNVLYSNNNTNITQLFNIFQNYNLIANSNKNPIINQSKSNKQNEIYDNFRISSDIFFVEPEQNIELVYPQTTDEITNNIKSIVSISVTNSTQTLKTSLIVPNVSLFSTNTTNWVTQPVYIQTSDTSIVTFTLPNNKNLSINNDIWFNTTCDNTNIYINYDFICPDGTLLNHTCFKEGTFSSKCPILKPLCHLFDFENKLFINSDLCITSTNYYNDNTICKCDLRYPSRKLTDKISSNQNSIMVVAISTYIASDIQTTFQESSKLNIQVFNNTRIILGIFSTIWGLGLILVILDYFKKKIYNNSKIDIDINVKINSALKTNSFMFIRSNLYEYIDKILPHVFLKEKSWFYNIYNELTHNHFYFKLINIWNNSSNNFFLIHLFNMITVLTMNIFFISLLYDTQIQNDDGSCSNYVTRQTCLQKKSVFDNKQTYCNWSTENNCVFQEQNVSLTTMVLIGFLASIFSEIISKPIDYLFDIIKSPSIDVVHNLTNEKTNHKITETRISNLKQINEFRLSHASSKSIVLRNNHLNSEKQKSTIIVLGNKDRYTLETDDKNDDDIEFYCEKQDETRLDEVPIDEVPIDEVPIDEVVRNNTKNVYSLYENDIKMKERLTNIINRQRLILNKDEHQLYDLQWGLNPIGQLFNVSGIISEMNNVNKLSNQYISNLKNSTNYDKGVEIIYLFIMDVLGRNTPEAKIFCSKFNEDHQRFSIVTNTSKRRSIVLILGINAFFIYYTVLHGLLKGIDWQTQFLYSCLIQLLIEVNLFETIECLYINIIIPYVVREKVFEAYQTLFELIDINCDINKKIKNDTCSNYINVPNILYVSTNVTKKYPDIIESVIVSSYNTCFPGKISAVWNKNNNKLYNLLYEKQDSIYTVMGISVFFISGFVFLIQTISTVPFMFQRVIIKFVQPVMLLSLVIVYNAIIQNIYLSVILCLLLSGLVGRFMYIMSVNKKRPTIL